RGGGTLASVPYVLSPGPDRLRLQRRHFVTDGTGYRPETAYTQGLLCRAARSPLAAQGLDDFREFTSHIRCTSLHALERDQGHRQWFRLVLQQLRYDLSAREDVHHAGVLVTYEHLRQQCAGPSHAVGTQEGRTHDGGFYCRGSAADHAEIRQRHHFVAAPVNGAKGQIFVVRNRLLVALRVEPGAAAYQENDVLSPRHDFPSGIKHARHQARNFSAARAREQAYNLLLCRDLEP